MTTPFEYATQQGDHYLNQLIDFLKIPSVSTDPKHKADMQKTAEWLKAHCESIGLNNVEIMETAGHPIVYADWLEAGEDKPTVLVYGHYDVQPVEDPSDPSVLGLWQSPPFEPTIRDGKLYARGATDDKGQTFVHLKAFDALMQSTGSFPVNIKLMIEGEEETGSANLLPYLKANLDLLKCDCVVVSDSDVLAEDIPSMTYGLRGMVYTEIEVRGGESDLHSGSFGGAVHNPVQALVEILAQLHDDNGTVTVPGFYDDVVPITDEERKALAAIPQTDEDFRREAQVKKLWGEKEYTFRERVGARPTLEINGMWGGFTGAGQKTVIGKKATAKVSCRLVANQNPNRIFDLIVKHIADITPDTVTSEVRNLSAYADPVLVPIEGDAMQVAAGAFEAVFGKKPVFIRSGGSIPVVGYLQQLMGVPVLLMGFGLPDDNLHAPNEKFNVNMFHKGIQTMMHFYQNIDQAF